MSSSPLLPLASSHDLCGLSTLTGREVIIRELKVPLKKKERENYMYNNLEKKRKKKIRTQEGIELMTSEVQ